MTPQDHNNLLITKQQHPDAMSCQESPTGPGQSPLWKPVTFEDFQHQFSPELLKKMLPIPRFNGSQETQGQGTAQ